MAATQAEEEEEAEYESDPEDSVLPSAMRRTEASDDEEGGGGGSDNGRADRRRSGAASDGEGGAPAYDDDDDGYGPGAEDEEGDLLEEELEYEVEEGDRERGVEEGSGRGGGGGQPEIRAAAEVAVEGIGGYHQSWDRESEDYQNQQLVEQEDKKDTEPYAVPTAGAFYMHDDRYRENRGGRQRHTPGGRKLWESKDDCAWEHDRFEQMNLQSSHTSEERMTYRRFYRGRGKFRGTGRGYGRGSRSRAYDGPQEDSDRPQSFHDEGSRGYIDRSRSYSDRSRSYDDKSAPNRAPKSVRGRGPRQYESLPSNKVLPATRNKQSAKPHESASNNNLKGRRPSQASNSQNKAASPQKQVLGSSLNSASPPFYPFGTSDQDLRVAPNEDVQTGSMSGSISSSMLPNNFLTTHSTPITKGKSVVNNVVRRERPQTDHVTGKNMSSLPMQSFGSSIPSSTTLPSRVKVPGRGLAIAEGQLKFQQSSSSNQDRRVSASMQLPAVQQIPTQPVLRAPAQQSSQRPTNGNMASYSSQVPITNASKGGISESPTGSSSKAPIALKEKVGVQAGGMGPFVYNGQLIGGNGALGFAHGDQNFAATPALLPVMQFSGQNHAGRGMPAVGMALPGYVAHPQLGFGSSEMAWLPMLSGASGAIGAQFGQYITLDSGFRAHPTGQTSSATSKETASARPGSSLESPKKSEPENDELGHRQNKPRRYSEMNFGQ